MKSHSQAEVSADSLDPPGHAGHLFVVPVFRNKELGTDEERLRDNSSRKFVVHASLGKSKKHSEVISISVPEGAGESFILANPNAVVTKLYANEGIVFIYHNSNRELARAEYECIATNLNEARNKFVSAFTPFLDHVSYLANVPIHIAQISVRDTAQEIQGAFYLSPYKTVQLNSHEVTLHNDLVPVYALYREAKNSSSPFYAFLCYYKILEGIFLIIRPRCFKSAKARGKELTTRKELVPRTKYLTERFSDIVGQPIKPIFDGRFQADFRNKVAHYLLNSSAALNVSDLNIFGTFSAENALIEACARTVIATQEEYLREASRK